MASKTFLRVRSLLTADSAVLDFGAGRGAWTDGGLAPLQRDLRDLKGHVVGVVGVDVDPEVLQNDSLDEVLQIELGGATPSSIWRWRITCWTCGSRGYLCGFS